MASDYKDARLGPQSVVQRQENSLRTIKSKECLKDFAGTGFPTEIRMKPYATQQYSGTSSSALLT